MLVFTDKIYKSDKYDPSSQLEQKLISIQVVQRGILSLQNMQLARLPVFFTKYPG